MENSTALLLEQYHATRDESLRNEIVLKNMGLVRSCALSLRNTFLKFGEVDDVVNEGVIALMNAIEAFDPEKGAKFETFATLKIRGAIIDYVRKQDWVPRSVRKFNHDLDNAYGELYNLYGRTPTNAELAEHMGIDEERLLKLLSEAACGATLSFEELLYEDNFDDDIASASSPDSVVMAKEAKKVIAEAIELLNEKERQVITLYFYKNMKYSDIAKALGITESRVCQINSKALLTLKSKLGSYFEGGIE